MRVRFLSTVLFFTYLFTAPSARALENFQKFERVIDSLYYCADYQTGVDLLRRSFDDANPDSVTAYLHHQLGIFSLEVADYSTAEAELLEAKLAYHTLGHSDTEREASILSRLAQLYNEQSRYEDALTAATDQLLIYQKIYRSQSRYTLLAVICLSEYALDAANISLADSVLTANKPALSSLESAADIARYYNVQGSLAFSRKQYLESKSFYTDALKKLPREGAPITAKIELARARARSILAEDDSAMIDISNAITHTSLSRNARNSFAALCYLVKATIEESSGNMDSAIVCFEKALSIYTSAATENFRYTSERERLLFIQDIRKNSGRVFSAASRSISFYPKISTLCYDWLLFQKGLLLTSIEASREQSRTSNDLQTVSLMDKLCELRAKRAAIGSKDALLLKKPYFTIDSIEHSIETIEKTLARRSAAYKRTTSIATIKWKDIQKRLRKNECAIEIAQFLYFDSEKPTNRGYYIGFAVDGNCTDYPRTSLINSATILSDPTIDGAYYRYIESADKKNTKAAQLVTKLLWEPLLILVDSSTTIYLSADGIYGKYSLGILPLTDKRLVMDTYKIAFIANSADIIRDSATFNGTVTIFAGANFGLQKGKNCFAPLPSTRIEALAISSTLTSRGWKSENFLSDEATENRLRQTVRPTILHIASHGTFQDSLGPRSTPTSLMLRSSLYLSGANTTLLGMRSDCKNDGIVTALEAMDLDLEGTELVTLSACRSGCGTIEPGEGVFGLPRAFRIAGAKNILMTLWPIPDKETSELMKLFYMNLVAGQSMIESLTNAQQQMRLIVINRYGHDIPQYWAGFMLIGL